MESRDQSVRDLREILCWVFALESLHCIWESLWPNLYKVLRQFGFLPLRNEILAVFFSVLAVNFGVGWWTVWKGRPSARKWATVASLTFILVFFERIIFPTRFIHWHHLGASAPTLIGLLGALVIGIAGPFVFSGRYDRAPEAEVTKYDDNPA